MPRLPALRTRILQELARQLRFASRDAARRQLERAEALAEQLLEESGSKDRAGLASAFPEEWVVYRITGLRTEGAGGEVVREALLGDLPGLVDRLSAAAKLTPKDLSGWIGADELCQRWTVSRKTLDRYRRMGLPSRRATLGRGRERVVYSERSIRAFERLHGERVRAAGGFSRIDAQSARRILRRAARYRARFGFTLDRCARRIAAREGRSVEAVRQLLRRHDRTLARPLFDEPGPLDAGQREWLDRAARRGKQLTGAAATVRKSRSTVYRSIAGTRARRLLELDLRGPVGPTFDRGDAGEVLLAHTAAREGLGAPLPASVAALIAEADRPEPETAAHEAARSAAYWFLIWSASRGVERMRATHARACPSSAALDDAETRLLWASRLKTEMVRSQLPLLVRTIAAQTERRPKALPGPVLRELVELGLESLVEAVERFDPFRGGRLAAPAGIGLTRAVSQWMRTNRARLGAPGRATARMDMAQLRLEDWSRAMHPWQEWLEPAAVVRESLARGEESERRVLALRLGWDGAPPRTLVEVARAIGSTPARIAAMQRRIIARWAFPTERAQRSRTTRKRR